jgi:hypothetical protein
MSIGATSPFRPTGTVSFVAGTTSVSILLAGGGESVLVTNATASLAYIRFGADASIAASSADLPLLPNTRALLSVNPLIAYAAALLASGSGSVLFTRGDGSYI